MDVDAATDTGVAQQQRPDSPVETLSEIGSKKHRMQTGEENDVFTRWALNFGVWLVFKNVFLQETLYRFAVLLRYRVGRGGIKTSSGAIWLVFCYFLFLFVSSRFQQHDNRSSAGSGRHLQ